MKKINTLLLSISSILKDCKNSKLTCINKQASPTTHYYKSSNLFRFFWFSLIVLSLMGGIASCDAQTRQSPSFLVPPLHTIEDFFVLSPVGHDITGRKFYDIKSKWGFVARIPADNDFIGLSDNYDGTEKSFYFTLNDPHKINAYGRPVVYMYSYGGVTGGGRTEIYTGVFATDINSEPWHDTGERVFGNKVYSNGFTGFKCSEFKETRPLGLPESVPLPPVGWEDEFHRRRVNSEGKYEYFGRGFNKENVIQRPWTEIARTSPADVLQRGSLDRTGVVYRIKNEKMDMELNCETSFRETITESELSPGERYRREKPYYKYSFECDASVDTTSGMKGSLNILFFEVNHTDDCRADLQLVAENAYKVFEKSISFELR